MFVYIKLKFIDGIEDPQLQILCTLIQVLWGPGR